MPVPRDAGPSRDAEGRVGHARPAGGDRGGEEAGDQRQAGDRGAGRRPLQRGLPRERVHVQGGVGAAQRADRLLARLLGPLRHVPPGVHRDGLVAAEAAGRPQPDLPWLPQRSLLPPVRDGVELARGGPGLRGGGGPVGPLPLPGHRGGRHGRRAGVPGVDHDPVDDPLQRGAGDPSGAGVRGGGAGRAAPDRGGRAGGARLRGGRPGGDPARAGGAGGAPLPASLRPARSHGRGGGGRLAGDPGRFRERRGGDGDRAHRPGLRLGRLRGRPGARAAHAAARGRRRPLRGGHPAGGRTLREGRRPGAAGGPGGAGRSVPARTGQALLPPLLALRQPADLHGPGLLVHPDHGGEGADAGEQPAGELARRRRSGPAGSASGWRATSTGRCPATATGAPRCRSGCATRRTSTGRSSGPTRSWPGGPARCPTTSIPTSPPSTSSPGRVRPAMGPCGGRPR